MLLRVNRGDYISATSHLGHPGVPPSLVMAAGQVVGRRIGGEYSDKLTASRAGNAILASLAIPLTFLIGALFLRFEVGLLAALLLVFDCQHLAFSRVAHIDAGLTVFVTASIALFLAAEQRSSTGLKLLAGLTWGLALATKATAVALLPALLLFKLIRWGLWTGAQEERPRPIDWSDLGAILVGHLALAAIWTKLWDPNHNFISVHHVNPAIARLIEGVGGVLRSHLELAIPAVLALIVTLLLFVRRKKWSWDRKSIALGLALILAGALSLCWLAAPALANITRFWGWVIGLSDVKHQAYGHAAQESTRLGYAEIWFRRLPSLVIVGTVVGLLSFRRARQSPSDNRLLAPVLLFAVPLLFTLMLSVSAKQSVRYLLPSFPALYLFAAWGLFEFAARFRRDSRLTSQLIIITVTAVQIAVAWSWYPHYSAFANSISGGFEVEVRRGVTLMPVEYERALEVVDSHARATGVRQRLAVAGDVDLMRYGYQRWLRGRDPMLEFWPFHTGYFSQWLLEFEDFRREREAVPNYRGRLEPELTHSLWGAPIYILYRIQPPDFSQPIVIPPVHTIHDTGWMRYEESMRIRHARPGRDLPGLLHFGQRLRAKPGNYRIRHRLALPAGLVKDVEPSAAVLLIELGNECRREVLRRELVAGAYTWIDMMCPLKEDRAPELRAYWYGNVGIKLAEIVIDRGEDDGMPK